MNRSYGSLSRDFKVVASLRPTGKAARDTLREQGIGSGGSWNQLAAVYYKMKPSTDVSRREAHSGELPKRSGFVYRYYVIAEVEVACCPQQNAYSGMRTSAVDCGIALASLPTVGQVPVPFSF